MSLSIFFCKRPNSICLLTGTKTIRGAERERETGFLVSLEMGQRQSKRRKRRGGQRHIGGRDSGVTEITESPPPTLPAVGGWLWWWWTGTRLSTRSLLSRLSAGRDRERKCHSRRACWANLDSAESCCSSLHNKSNTITPTPSPNTAPHTHTQISFRLCL